jgi:hypothetical protein
MQWVVLGVVAAIPVGVYGVVFRALGWYWLPNSLLLKGARPDVSSVHGLVQALDTISYSRLIELPARDPARGYRLLEKSSSVILAPGGIALRTR